MIGGDQGRGLRLVEYHHIINAFQRGKNLGAIILRHDGAIWPLAPANRRIGVEADHERVALFPCEVEVIHVSRVQDVETAVGEDELEGFLAKARAFLLHGSATQYL